MHLPSQSPQGNAMRYFKGLFLASEPRVEFCLSRVSWIPLLSWGHLGPPRGPCIPPQVSQKLRGARTKLRLEMVFLHPHPLALGPLPGRLVGRKPVSAFAHPPKTGRDHPPGRTGKEKAKGKVSHQALGKGTKSLFQVTWTAPQVPRFQC